MKEATGCLWNELGKADIICITTNGFIKLDGSAVMGRGCAKQAADMWPELPRTLGLAIKLCGNVVQSLMKDESTTIMSFPVKPDSAICDGTNTVEHMKWRYEPGEGVPGWACKASLELIKRSAQQLAHIVQGFNLYENRLMRVVMPRPGCGAGELDWTVVKKVLAPIFDDQYIIYTYR